MKENPKYRTHDSPMYVEPEVEWPESMTDPSQAIKVDDLVRRHVRGGSPEHGMPYGDDLSRVGFTELYEMQSVLVRELEKRQAEERELAQKQQEAVLNEQRETRAKLLRELKAGSPELQQLAAELTRKLPGFGEDPPAPPAGPSLGSPAGSPG